MNKEPYAMSNDLTQDYPADDGWGDTADEASSRMIRGSLLKFADWRWTSGKERTPIADGTSFVAMAVAAAWIRWEDRKIAEQRVRRPGERMVEREDLGHDDESEWETGPGGDPQDPWQNTRYVYLVDPQSAEAYTFSTSSWGGREAVVDLGDTIARMRRVHADAVPIVELRAREWPTKYGRKSKPYFKVVGWKTAGGEGAAVGIGDGGGGGNGAAAKPAIVERLMPKEEVKRAERQIRNQEIDDDIPF
jgi:hypothetical protein